MEDPSRHTWAAEPDAEDEDFQNHLSPADGFRRTPVSSPDTSSPTYLALGDEPLCAHIPHIPNVLVRDPTLEQRRALSKAEEARQDRLNTPDCSTAQEDVQSSVIANSSHSNPLPALSSSHTRPTSPGSSDTHRQHPSPSMLSSPSGQSPLSRPGPRSPRPTGVSEAPPAYTISAVQASGPPQNYQTFYSTMGNPEEETRWLLAQEPQSMAGGLPTLPNGRHPAWVRHRVPSERSCLRRCIFAALVISVVLSIVGGVSRAVFFHGGHFGYVEHMVDFSPIADEELPWKPGAFCLPYENRLSPEKFDVQFEPERDLRIHQTFDHDNNHGRLPSVSGDIVLRGVDEVADAGIDVEVITNDDNLLPIITWNEKKQLLNITTPRATAWGSRLAPCINIRVTLRIPTSSVAALETLVLESTSLNFNFEDSVRLHTYRLIIDGVVGDVVAKTGSEIDSRVIEISSVSGDVVGGFPLFDVLKLSTVSGSIDVQTDPRPVDEANPKPAVLTVTSVSGHVTVTEPIDAVPDREYVTELSSRSGNIKATAAFGVQAQANTISGNIALTLLPVLDASREAGCGASSLTTKTISGGTELTLLEPQWFTSAPDSAARHSLKFAERPLTCFQSTHTSMSGRVSVQYPDSWEGKYQAKTLTGAISIEGTDLHPGLALPRNVQGTKGNGDSFLNLKSVSGSIHAVLGSPNE